MPVYAKKAKVVHYGSIDEQLRSGSTGLGTNAIETGKAAGNINITDTCKSDFIDIKLIRLESAVNQN